MIIIKRIALLFLLLLLLVFALLYYVTSTESGKQRAFAVAKDYLGEDLSVESVQGRLIGPGKLENVAFMNAAGLELQARSVDYDWTPKNLLSRELSVSRLDIDGITLRIPEPASAEGDATAEPFQLSDLKIPFALNADHVQITDLTIYSPGVDEPFVIDEIYLRAGGKDDALEVLEFRVAAPQGKLNIDGMLNTSGDWPFDADTSWSFNHSQYGDFAGSGTAAGDLKLFKVKHELEGFVNATIDIDVSDVAGDLSWDGDISADSDDLSVLGPELSGTPFTIDVKVDGNLELYNARGNFTTAHTETGPLSTDFNLSSDLEQVVFSDSTMSFEQSTTELVYAGIVDLKPLRADFIVDWTELEYPLVADPKLVISPAGTLEFSGNAEDYNVQLDTVVEQEIAGDLKVQLEASGTPEQVRIKALTIDGPPTSVNGTGVVDLNTRKVDIKGGWKDVRWPLIGDEVLVSSSSAQFSVVGTLDDYQVDAELALTGKDMPPGDWKLSTRGNTEKLTGLELSGNVLEGQINATGDVVFVPQPEWDLELQADGINPGAKWPEHEGKITFASTTKGRMTDNGPDLVADIKSLSGSYKVQELGGGGNIKFSDGNFSADNLSVKLGSATIDLDGAVGDDLNLKWQMNADQISSLVPGIEGDIAFNGNISGSRDAPKLEFNLDASDFQSGSIKSKSFKGGGLIDLTGNTASEIDITGESLTVAGYKWRDVKIFGGGKPDKHELSVVMTGEAPDVALNLNGSVSGERWNGSLDKLELIETAIGDWKLYEPVAIEATKSDFSTGILCLTNLPAVLCTDTAWSAELGVKSRVGLEKFNSELLRDLMPPDISVDAPLSGKVDFSMRPGGNPNAVGEFFIPEGRVQYTNEGDVITAILGSSTASVNLEDNQVTTTADLALGEIGTLKANTVITDLYGAQNLSGTIDSEIQDISLAGIGASQLSSIDGAFSSDVKLGGTLQTPQVVGGLNLTGFGAEIPSISLKLYDGNIEAVSDGKGNLEVSGQIKSGEGELTISGLVNPESGGVDLQLSGEDFQVANAKRQKVVISPDLKIAINGEEISVLGDLLIPSAFITAGGDSGVLTESPDVVVKESADIEIEKPEESRVRLGIDVELGDDVRVKVGQFNGALGGGLGLEQVPGKVPTGSGVVEVIGGDYLVYGQKLSVETGRVLFGGGPLDNPALEFDVFRDVTEFDVKAGVQIRGTAQVPLLELQSDPEQTDANTLSFILFGKPVGEGISYTLGKFITPDLYISYGIDILTKVQAFNMRYKLTDRLTLFGTRSTESGADLFYTIER